MGIFSRNSYLVPGDILLNIARAFKDGLATAEGDPVRTEPLWGGANGITDPYTLAALAVVGGGLLFVPPTGDVTGVKDTAALQAAIASCANTSRGIGFADADYYFNATSDITDGYRTAFEAVRTGLAPDLTTVVVPPKLVGAGLYRTRFRMVTPSIPLLRFYGTTAGTQIQSPVIQGITFYGPGASSGTYRSAAMQFGGVSSTYKNITADPMIASCGFMNWHTGVRHDDTTGATYEKCFFQSTLYCVDRGYNCDVFTFRACDFGDQSLTSKISCTITNGSTALTTTGNLFNNLVKGATVYGPGIPAGTTVTAITNGNSAVISAAATATSTSTCYFFYGTAVCDSIAGYGSGWVAPYGSTGNSNITIFDGCWFLRMKMAIGAYASSTSSIHFNNCYTELMWKLAELGNPGDTGCPTGFTVENTHFSQTESFKVNGVVDVLSAGATTGCMFKFVDNRSDAINPSASNVPWIYAPASYNSAAAVEWDRNVLGTNAGVPTVNVAGSAATIPDKTRYVVGTGAGVENGGFVRYYTVSSNGATLNWDYGGEDQFQITLDGNFTLNNNGSQNPPKGRRITFIFTADATAGRTITFGTKYLNASGIAIGAFTASVASKIAIFDFIWDGLNWRQMNTAQWV